MVKSGHCVAGGLSEQLCQIRQRQCLVKYNTDTLRFT